MVTPALLALLAGPFAGSFVGVLVRRLPAGRPVLLGRSACEACRHALGARDLVPLASYAVLRGRCRFCGAAIAGFHPSIELAGLAVATSAVLADGADPARLACGCGLGWVLLALAWIDAEHLRLPDVLTLPLLLAGLGATWWLDPDALTDHAAAAAFGYGAFRLLGLLYRWRRGREGLGQGDAKLLAAAGAWLGVAGLPWVMLGGALLGLAWAWARGGRLAAGTAVPFGPSLAVATWVLWLVG